MPLVDTYVNIEVEIEREVCVDIEIDQVLDEVYCSGCDSQLCWEVGDDAVIVEPCSICCDRAYDEGLEAGRKEQQINIEKFKE